MKKTIPTLITAALLALNARAGQLDTRIAVQPDEKPTSQFVLKEDGLKAVYQEGVNDVAAINVEKEGVRVNLSRKNDDTKVLGGVHTEYGFFEAEKVDVAGNTIHSFNLGLRPFENIEVQTAVNNDNDFAAVVFYDMKNGTVAFGGKHDEGISQLNASISGKVTDDMNVAIYARVAENGNQDLRLRAGRKLWSQKSKIFSVNKAGFNAIDGFDDQTIPFTVGPIDLYDPESNCGTETGDVSVDIRYNDFAQDAHANGTVNVGDYGFIEDVKFTGGVTRDLSTDADGINGRVQAKTKLGGLDLLLQGQVHAEENSKPATAAYVSFVTEF